MDSLHSASFGGAATAAAASPAYRSLPSSSSDLSGRVTKLDLDNVGYLSPSSSGSDRNMSPQPSNSFPDVHSFTLLKKSPKRTFEKEFRAHLTILLKGLSSIYNQEIICKEGWAFIIGGIQSYLKSKPEYYLTKSSVLLENASPALKNIASKLKETPLLVIFEERLKLVWQLSMEYLQKKLESTTWVNRWLTVLEDLFESPTLSSFLNVYSQAIKNGENEKLLSLILGESIINELKKFNSLSEKDLHLTLIDQSFHKGQACKVFKQRNPWEKKTLSISTITATHFGTADFPAAGVPFNGNLYYSSLKVNGKRLTFSKLSGSLLEVQSHYFEELFKLFNISSGTAKYWAMQMDKNVPSNVIHLMSASARDFWAINVFSDYPFFKEELTYLEKAPICEWNLSKDLSSIKQKKWIVLYLKSDPGRPLAKIKLEYIYQFNNKSYEHRFNLSKLIFLKSTVDEMAKIVDSLHRNDEKKIEEI